LWDAALTAAEVTSMYLSSAGRTQRVAVDAALDILASAGNKLVFATSPARAEEGVIEEDPLVAMLLQRAQESLVACEPFEARLDLYASAAERGSAEALYKWALLVKQGSEMANSACGVATAEDTDRTPSALKSAASSLWSAGTAAAPSSAESLADQERAVQAMLIAADMGHAPALVSLAFALVNGAGIDAFFRTDVPVSTTQIPVHPTYHTVSTTGAHVYRTSRLQNAIASYLRNRPAACANIPWKFPATSGLTLDRHALAQSVLHWNSSALPRAGAADPEGTGSHCPDASQLSMGLLQLAAMHRNTEAHQALSYRWIYFVLKQILLPVGDAFPPFSPWSFSGTAKG
jgi:TPR repeat protein